MAANIVKWDGKTMTWTNGGTAVSSGDVVKVGTVSAIAGIALTDIANGATGELAIGAVATIPKVSAAVFEQGDQVLYDASATPAGAVDDNAATPATGDFLCGTAEVAGANAETTATIRLNPMSTAVT